MGLQPIASGLGNPTRRLVNNNKSAAKVLVVVDPGEEVIVAENVADQLERAGFASVTDPGAVRAGMEAEAERLAPPPEFPDTEPFDNPPKVNPPRKRAAKKAAPKADTE